MAPADTPACCARASRLSRARWRSRRSASPIESGPRPRSATGAGAGFVTVSRMSWAISEVSAFAAGNLNPCDFGADAHDIAGDPTDRQDVDHAPWQDTRPASAYGRWRGPSRRSNSVLGTLRGRYGRRSSPE